MRLGLGDKAFLRLGNSSLLQRVTSILAPCATRVVVAVAPDRMEQARLEITGAQGGHGTCEIIAGGVTRRETIERLAAVCHDDAVTLVHDVASPFITARLIGEVVQGALEHGAAAAYAHPCQPSALLRAGMLTECRPASQTALVRCPVAMRCLTLRRVLKIEREARDLSLAEMCWRGGVPLFGVHCDDSNIKITTPDDWQNASQVIAPTFDRPQSQQLVRDAASRRH